MKRPDIAIGHRAAAEVKRLYRKKTHAMIDLGCGDSLNAWEWGEPPSAVQLACLHELGADVIWILTGRRTL